MVKVNTLPEYSALTKALAKYAITPAEMHGIICALISLNRPCTLVNLKSYFTKPKARISKKLSHLLQQLIDYTYLKIVGLDFEFELMLPNEEETLANRAEALNLWCEGFIFAFQKNTVDIRRLPIDSQDAITHITAIAGLKQETMTIYEEDEPAYTEVVEYVRMVVLMIYGDVQDLATGRTSYGRLH